MGGTGYAQEMSVNFIRIDEVGVVVNVRGVERHLDAGPEKVDQVRGMELSEGEKVRLLYTGKEVWELKKLNFNNLTSKYFRRDE